MICIITIYVHYSSKSTHDLPDGSNYKAKGALDYNFTLSPAEITAFYSRNVFDGQQNGDMEFMYQRLWDKSKGVQYYSLQNRYKSHRNDSSVIQYYDDIEGGTYVKLYYFSWKYRL